MSTTATENSAEELREQLAAHQQAAAEAERELGAAALDGTSAAGATKRARAAREGIQRCEAALEELARREAEAAEEARRSEASRERLASYEWMVRYLGLLEAYLRARAEFKESGDALKKLPIDGKCRSAWRGGRFNSEEESDLDTELLIAVPDPSGTPGRKGVVRGYEATEISLERVRELRGFAEIRAEEERAGHGVDRSQPFGTRDREINERRKAERAKAQQAAG